MTPQGRAVEIHNINLSLRRNAPKAYAAVAEEKELTLAEAEENMARRQFKPTKADQQPGTIGLAEDPQATDKAAQGGQPSSLIDEREVSRDAAKQIEAAQQSNLVDQPLKDTKKSPRTGLVDAGAPIAGRDTGVAQKDDGAQVASTQEAADLTAGE